VFLCWGKDKAVAAHSQSKGAIKQTMKTGVHLLGTGTFLVTLLRVTIRSEACICELRFMTTRYCEYERMKPNRVIGLRV
jgi:hypothetical protein